MNHETNLKKIQQEWHGSLEHYLIGFIVSLILTLSSFFFVGARLFTEDTLIYTIVGLAIFQAIIQLIFFFHLGRETKPQWSRFSFYVMVTVLLTILIGSIWIMNDLNERMMSFMTEGHHHHD